MNKEKTTKEILRDAIIASTIMYVAGVVGNMLVYIYREKGGK